MEAFLNNSNLVLGVSVAIAAIVGVKYLISPKDNESAIQAALARQKQEKLAKEKMNEEIEKARRYFTLEELKAYTGENGNPIYIAVLDDIFDVSSKRDFYGPGEGYHLFAGRDASRALAKMSFEPEDLENEDLSDLEFMEKETLQDWVEKFTVYNAYPIVGRVIRQKDLTREELRKYNGIDNPRKSVYVGINGTIYDVTLKGMDHYGPNGGYKMFAGRDASKALACMSFDEACLDNPSTDDLTQQQKDTLTNWENKFKEKYVVVGKILD